MIQIDERENNWEWMWHYLEVGGAADSGLDPTDDNVYFRKPNTGRHATGGLQILKILPKQAHRVRVT